MAKPGPKSLIYRLIAAGQLARQALLLPLAESGLEAGDDAVLFLMRRRGSCAEGELTDALGISAAALGPHVARLEAHGLIARHANAGLALTDNGRELRATLAESWRRLESDLVGEIRRKRRTALRKTLGRMVERLGG